MHSLPRWYPTLSDRDHELRALQGSVKLLIELEQLFFSFLLATSPCMLTALFSGGSRADHHSRKVWTGQHHTASSGEFLKSMPVMIKPFISTENRQPLNEAFDEASIATSKGEQGMGAFWVGSTYHPL